MTRRAIQPTTTPKEATMAANPFPAPVPMVPHEAAAEASRILVQRQQEKLAREARAAGPGTVTLVATSSFTIVESADQPEGRVVEAGQEFTVTKAELPRYVGRGMPVVPAEG